MRRVVFLAGYALTSCSGGGGSLIDRDGNGFVRDGGDGYVKAPGNAQAALRLNGGAAADCANVPGFSLGQFSDGSPPAAVLVKNGDPKEGGLVDVTCRVKDTGNGFDVSLYAADDSGLSIAAAVDAVGNGAAGKMTFKTTTGAWQSETCTLDASGPFMGVAAGRYWGMFACTSAKSSNGGACDVFGEVRFENCAQQ